jgi:hypothetical protein
VLDRMIQFFTSAFVFPGLGWKLVLIAIGIGIVFGAVWLAEKQVWRVVAGCTDHTGGDAPGP